jgi:serine phosphatase RsbU (regulator of sigma subunit)
MRSRRPWGEDAEDGAPPGGLFGRFDLLSFAALLILIAVTAAVTILVHVAVVNQEKRLLTERGREVNLVLATSIDTISSNLSLLAADAGRGDVAFVRDAQAQLSSTPSSGPTALALVRPAGSSFVVMAAAGTGLAPGQMLTGAAATAVTAAEGQPAMVATPVYRAGQSRWLGFALRATDGSVVFRQSALGPVRPPSQAGTAPFSELRVVLYASARPDPSQVLVATTSSIPRHDTVGLPLMAGATKWLTAVSAIHPLVGSLAANAQWVALGVGLAGSALVFLLLQGMAYRRDLAVHALMSEHRFAETLQRRLLPTVPALPGLDVASSYVTGADRQQVGGDWFDVFELSSGQVALVIGDVMGHDVEAAATMAQLRASLRSYSAEGGDPGWTIERLANFIDLFKVPSVVTAVYGVLDRPGPDGSRRFSWSNAGHLPPLLRWPDGRVEELGEGSSPLLGAPSKLPRPMGERVLPPGSTLLLYTDGLVEIQGENLAVTVGHLQRVLSSADQATAQDVCATILEAQLPSRRRDDVAVLVVRISAGAPQAERDPEAAASTV